MTSSSKMYDLCSGFLSGFIRIKCKGYNSLYYGAQGL